MNKLSKGLKALQILAKKPYLLNLILENEDEYRNYVSKTYGLPKGLPTIEFTDFFQGEDTISPYSFLEGSSLITDFALLRALCKIISAEDYLEIGTWRGESVANVSPLVKNCVTLNLPDKTMRGLGLSEDYISMHRHFSNNLNNVKHIQADSTTYDFDSLNAKFDLIFLDGDHHTNTIASDTANAFKLLKNENSVIVWHDYGFGTETTRFNVLAGILDGCPPEKIKNLYRVSHTLCAIYTTKDIKATIKKPDTKPDYYFESLLKIRK
jgi:hypothetical protein